MDLSVVIPVYNEQDNVVSLCQEVRRALDGRCDYEVIFVDDGSTDGTGVALQRLVANHSRVRMVCHLRNSGQSAALLTGCREARARWIATLDGDGQNDPADLLRLREQAERSGMPADLYIGHRVERHDSWIRLLSSRVANDVRSWLLRDGVPDTGCGIKLFRGDAFLALPYFDHMHRFLPALIRREGGRVESIPVRHRPRRAGQSKYGISNRLWAGIVDLLGVIWLLRRRRLPFPPRVSGDGR